MLRHILLFISCLLFSAFSVAESRIGISMAAYDDYFLTMLRDSIANEAQELDGITLSFTDAQVDADRQMAQVDDFIKNKYAAIIVNPVDVSGSYTETMSQKTRQAGIPLIFVNRKPDILMGNGVYYVGSDSYLSGKLQMDYLAKTNRGKGEIVILVGTTGSGVARDRTQAVKDVIAKYPQMHLVDEQVANFNRTDGETVMNHWIQEGKQFNIVVANNDEMALGALIAMKKAGISPKKIQVIGIDATPDALYSMYQNELHATVFQNAVEQGKLALKTAVTLAMGKNNKLPSEILIPYQLVTPANYRMYLNK
jgi:inositol transport system substrate-binding protein